jgi:hypothetical protein
MAKTQDVSQPYMNTMKLFLSENITSPRYFFRLLEICEIKDILKETEWFTVTSSNS